MSPCHLVREVTQRQQGDPVPFYTDGDIGCTPGTATAVGGRRCHPRGWGAAPSAMLTMLEASHSQCTVCRGRASSSLVPFLCVGGTPAFAVLRLSKCTRPHALCLRLLLVMRQCVPYAPIYTRTRVIPNRYSRCVLLCSVCLPVRLTRTRVTNPLTMRGRSAPCCVPHGKLR